MGNRDIGLQKYTLLLVDAQSAHRQNKHRLKKIVKIAARSTSALSSAQHSCCVLARAGMFRQRFLFRRNQTTLLEVWTDKSSPEMIFPLRGVKISLVCVVFFPLKTPVRGNSAVLRLFRVS